MSEVTPVGVPPPADMDRRLAILLALAVPLFAGLLGLVTSFRMMRLPDPSPSSSAEGMVLG